MKSLLPLILALGLPLETYAARSPDLFQNDVLEFVGPVMEPFYGVPEEYVTCVVILNATGRKDAAFQFGILGDTIITDVQRAEMFGEIGFSSFKAFSLEMSVDEAREILYHTSNATEAELIELAIECAEYIK